MEFLETTVGCGALKTVARMGVKFYCKQALLQLANFMAQDRRYRDIKFFALVQGRRQPEIRGGTNQATKTCKNLASFKKV